MPRTKKTLGKDQTKATFNPFRFRLVCLGVVACLVFLIMRVGDLQLLDRPMLEKEADQRSLREVVLPTNRGTLLDRNGDTLALSVPSRDIIADPLKVLEANPDFYDAKWTYLASALNLRPAELAAAITASPKNVFSTSAEKLNWGLPKISPDCIWPGFPVSMMTAVFTR